MIILKFSPYIISLNYLRNLIEIKWNIFETYQNLSILKEVIKTSIIYLVILMRIFIWKYE